MSVENKTIGARLRAARKGHGLVVADLAERFREVAPQRVAQRLPKRRDLERTIRGHEAGEHTVGERYRLLYAAALDVPEHELFAPGPADQPPPWRPDGALTPDDEERLTMVSARPARLDASTLEALADVLAGQRRLEDAIGPAALLTPVASQLNVITTTLRDASGPLRDRFGRIVAEWTVYAGWLHAALREDARALAMFGRGEELADDFADGTIAAIATSFRGYVARQQNRPRAVVRASQAAMAAPGGHPAQRTFDELQAAQGYAALGDRDKTLRMLDKAAERAADAIEPPPAVYWYSEPFFQLNIGMVNRDIGEYGHAAAMLGAGLDGMPADQLGAEWLSEYRAAFAEAKDHA